eukprot:SAG11_NODE_26263_length_347_cov_1.225806_1_plen_47_part_10
MRDPVPALLILTILCGRYIILASWTHAPENVGAVVLRVVPEHMAAAS